MEKEEKKPYIKVEKSTSHLVLKKFTHGERYVKGSTFVTSNSKLREKLINEKFIK